MLLTVMLLTVMYFTVMLYTSIFHISVGSFERFTAERRDVFVGSHQSYTA